jgi:hypothetical protein
MRNLNPEIVFSIAQIFSTFVDSLGNRRTVSGTGFLLAVDTSFKVFVTNRHNLDPTLKLTSDFSLQHLEIRLRHKSPDGWSADTKMTSVDLQRTRIVHSLGADVSLVVTPKFLNLPPQHTLYAINTTNLADQSFFAEKVAITDLLSFVGYPGSGNTKWWDEKWQTPVARLASQASAPQFPFTNAGISTSDVSLVSGLSFAGSSGSMVLLHDKGVPPGVIDDPAYAPGTIVGLMSGHWWDSAKDPEIFRHSGLSYYTRSTSILELIATL